MVTAYKQLLFRCQNLSCLHEEECGEAHLWASYLRREEIEAQHKLCREGWLKISHGKYAGEYGKIKGSFGAYTFLRIQNRRVITQYTDPRLFKAFEIQDKKSCENYVYYRDNRPWMSYDIGWRCGYHQGIWHVYLWLKYWTIKDNINPLTMAKKNLKKVIKSRDSYLNMWEENRLELKRQCSVLKHPDFSLVASTYGLGTADGQIVAYQQSIRLLRDNGRFA